MAELQAGESPQWGQIVAKAWSDESFKKRLLANPAAVLKEQGLAVPKGVQVQIAEDTDTLVHLSLPPRPTERELSEEDLAAVAGGLSLTKWLCFGCNNPEPRTTRNWGCTSETLG